MRIVISVCMILFCFVSTGNTQSCHDSIYQVQMNQVHEYIEQGRSLSAISVLDSLFSQITELDRSTCSIYYMAKYERAHLHFVHAELSEAQEIFKEILSEPAINHFPREKAMAHIGLSLAYEWIQNEEPSRHNLAEAEKIIAEHQLDEVKTLFYVRRSSFNRVFGNLPQALIDARKALKHIDQAVMDRDAIDAYYLVSVLSEDPEEIRRNTDLQLKSYIDNKHYLSAAIMYASNRIIHEKPTPELRQLYYDTAWYYMAQVKEVNPEYYLYGSGLAKHCRVNFERMGMMDSAYHYAVVELDYSNKHKLIESRRKLEANEVKFNYIRKQAELDQLSQERSFLLTAIYIGLAVLAFISWLLYKIVITRNRIIQQNSEIVTKNQRLKEASDSNTLLLAEIHHRVKNNLQNIISLMFLKSRKTSNAEVRALIDEFSEKIKSISLVHDQLYQSEEFERINFENYVTTLIANSSSYNEQMLGSTVQIDASFLNIETTIPLGIILSELLTNSVKHNAALENLSCEITLKRQDDLYTLIYTDNGKGLPENYAEKAGIGLELIRILVRQLRGELILKSQKGMYCAIQFKEKVTSSI